jgi:hypothetical protein
MVGDEVLSARGDPGQITNTQLLTFPKSRRKHEPSRVREHPRPFSCFPRSFYPWQPHAYRLGPRGVETQ